MEEKKTVNKSVFAFIFILIALVAVTIYGALEINKNDLKKEEDNKINNMVSYHEFDECTYEEMYEEDGKIYINDEVVYECQSTGEFGCYLPVIEGFEYCNQTDSVVLISDNEKDFLYNFKTKEVVLEADYIDEAIYNELGTIAYLVFYQNNKAGLASLKGDILIQPAYDDISLSYGYGAFSGEYSLRYGITAAKQNGKIGLIEMETGKKVLSFEYDDIRVYDGYYVLKKNNKAYLVDYKFNTILDDNFDDIIISNDIVIAEKNKLLSFYDLSGNKIVDDTVKVNRSYTYFNDTGYEVFNMELSNYNTTIIVFGNNNDYTDDYERDYEYDYEACYNLNLLDKKLETTDCSNYFD